MKTIISVVGISFLVSFGCDQSGTSATFSNDGDQEDLTLYACLIQSDAEKILGQPALRTEKSAGREGSIMKYKCTYQGASPDPKTGRPSNLYYILELYGDGASAHKAYTGIVSANTQLPGQSAINNIGDEAWLHSDGGNFHLLIFRKENKMVRIKINKVTATTSLDELQKVVKEISLHI